MRPGVRTLLAAAVALFAAAGTGAVGLLVTEGAAWSGEDLLGVLSIVVVGGALLVALAHIPLLAFARRRTGHITTLRRIALAAVVANTPVYLLLAVGHRRGGVFGAGEAGVFAAAFAVLGIVFAALFATKRPSAPPRPDA